MVSEICYRWLRFWINVNEGCPSCASSMMLSRCVSFPITMTLTIWVNGKVSSSIDKWLSAGVPMTHLLWLIKLADMVHSIVFMSKVTNYLSPPLLTIWKQHDYGFHSNFSSDNNLYSSPFNSRKKSEFMTNIIVLIAISVYSDDIWHSRHYNYTML